MGNSDKNMMQSNFSKWSASAYLREYYSESADQAYAPSLKFLAEQRSRLCDDPDLVEIGCGPTVYHLLPLAPAVKSVVVADYLPSNLEQIRWWVQEMPETHSWEVYTRYILGCEGVPQTSAEIQKRENLLRGEIIDYLPCDVRHKDPLGPAQRQSWRAVLSCYCADSITRDVAEWRTYMINILSLVAPGGVFLGAALAKSQNYVVEGKMFPSAGVTADDFVQLFRDLRHEDVVVECEMSQEFGYEGQLFAAGRAPK